MGSLVTVWMLNPWKPARGCAVIYMDGHNTKWSHCNLLCDCMCCGNSRRSEGILSRLIGAALQKYSTVFFMWPYHRVESSLCLCAGMKLLCDWKCWKSAGDPEKLITIWPGEEQKVLNTILHSRKWGSIALGLKLCRGPTLPHSGESHLL